MVLELQRKDPDDHGVFSRVAREPDDGSWCSGLAGSAQTLIGNLGSNANRAGVTRVSWRYPITISRKCQKMDQDQTVG